MPPAPLLKSATKAPANLTVNTAGSSASHQCAIFAPSARPALRPWNPTPQPQAVFPLSASVKTCLQIGLIIPANWKEGQMPRLTRYAAQFLFLCSLFPVFASAQTSAPISAPTPAVASQTATSPSFDADPAVEAYLADTPPDERARSNAYVEGGYWLLLWHFLSTVLVMWILRRF